MIPVDNLFEGIPPSIPEELFLTLFRNENIRIEQIVSGGHASPPDFWYDQDNPEWVLLLAGSAVMEFPDGKTIELKKGDYFLIPSHQRHRISKVSEDAIWLAIHIGL
ncbi:MAG: cupin domain-containing protein [Chthoniobacterales bacterium]